MLILALRSHIICRVIITFLHRLQNGYKHIKEVSVEFKKTLLEEDTHTHAHMQAHRAKLKSHRVKVKPQGLPHSKGGVYDPVQTDEQ